MIECRKVDGGMRADVLTFGPADPGVNEERTVDLAVLGGPETE